MDWCGEGTGKGCQHLWLLCLSSWLLQSRDLVHGIQTPGPVLPKPLVTVTWSLVPTPPPPRQSSTLGLEETRRDTDAECGRLVTSLALRQTWELRGKLPRGEEGRARSGRSWRFSAAHEVTQNIRRPHVGLGVAEVAPSQVGTCSSGNWQRRLFQSLW